MLIEIYHRVKQQLQQKNKNFLTLNHSLMSHFSLKSLLSVLDLQISIWLKHPKTIATGIYWWQFCLGVAHLQIEMGYD